MAAGQGRASEGDGKGWENGRRIAHPMIWRKGPGVQGPCTGGRPDCHRWRHSGRAARRHTGSLRPTLGPVPAFAAAPDPESAARLLVAEISARGFVFLGISDNKIHPLEPRAWDVYVENVWPEFTAALPSQAQVLEGLPSGLVFFGPLAGYESAGRPALPIEVLPASPEHAHAIATIHVAAWRSAYQGIVPDGVLADQSVERRERYWQAALTEGQPIVLVARICGAVVGWVAFGPCRDVGEPSHAGEVWAIYIDPETGSGATDRTVAVCSWRGDPLCRSTSHAAIDHLPAHLARPRPAIHRVA